MTRVRTMIYQTRETSLNHIFQHRKEGSKYQMQLSILGEIWGIEPVRDRTTWSILANDNNGNFSVDRAIIKKYKTRSVFLSSYKNTKGSLGEREMLWKHEPQASVSTAFSSSPKLSRVFLQLDRNTENMFYISFRKHRDEKKKSNFSTLIIKI